MRIKTRSIPEAIRDQPGPKRNSKFGNQPCYDASGNYYHSKAERSATLALVDAWTRGDCSEPKRDKYSFDLNEVHIGNYTSDAEVDVYKTFTLITGGGVYTFQAGQRYVIDVKSPATLTVDSKLRFQLMLAFYGITVTVVLTRQPEKRVGKKK